jgi:hypothetical protein
MKCRALLVMVLVALTWTTAHGEDLEQASFPSLLSAVRMTGPLSFCGERVPLEDRDVRERMEKEMLLALWDRPQVMLWLKRSPRYLPVIAAILKEAGMPDDLQYVAVAESALRPHAGSHKGAVGFWQFTAATGRTYGLTIDEHIDERRNIVTSTHAAVRYFGELYRMCGSWSLAAAAYNMGEDGLMAEVLAQETSDYYRLYLPLETQRYVLRIVATKLIVSSPERYGFRLGPADYYPPVVGDRVEVDLFEEVPIALVARAARTDFKIIKDLNPQLRGHYLPPGHRPIAVPEGSGSGFERRFRKAVKTWKTEKQERVYVVAQGDTLAAIAERFGVPLTALIIWNRLDPSALIHPGDRLVIHRVERMHDRADPDTGVDDHPRPATE